MNILPRSITPYRFDPGAVDFTGLAEKLQHLVLANPGPLESKRVGFLPAFGDDNDPFIVTSGTFTTFRVGIKTKIVPSAAINERLRERISAVEAKGGEVGGRLRRTLRAEVMDELLAQALCKLVSVQGIIDARGWLLLETTSAGAADACLERLRDAVGSLPVVRCARGSLEGSLRQWADGHTLPENFSLGNACVVELQDGALWTGKGVDLDSSEVHAYMASGAKVRRLGLVFDDAVSFVLDREFTLRQIVMEDETADAEIEHEDRDAYTAWWVERAGTCATSLLDALAAAVREDASGE